MENKNNIEQLKKENQFSVPQQYFDELPQRIHNKRNSTENNTLFSNKLYYKVLAPAMVLLILFASYYVFQSSSNIELTPQEISEVVINQELIQMDTEMIYEVYAETATPTTSTNNEEIIDYLINENISINLIMKEL